MLNMKSGWIIIFIFILFSCNKKPDKPVMTPQEKYISEHPEMSADMKKNILEGTIEIGMNEEQVIASWGMPDDIQTFASEYNSYKRWIYKDRPKVYWKDGKVSQLLK